MAVFELYTSKPEDYRILIRFDDKIEFTSKSLNSRVECFQLIRLIRSKGHIDLYYKIKKLSCGSWCFEMVEPSRKNILGRSRTYEDEITISNKISQMKATIQKAKVKVLKIN